MSPTTRSSHQLWRRLDWCSCLSSFHMTMFFYCHHPYTGLSNNNRSSDESSQASTVPNTVSHVKLKWIMMLMTKTAWLHEIIKTRDWWKTKITTIWLKYNFVSASTPRKKREKKILVSRVDETDVSIIIQFSLPEIIKINRTKAKLMIRARTKLWIDNDDVLNS